MVNRRKLLEASPEFRAAYYFVHQTDEIVVERGWRWMLKEYGPIRASRAWRDACVAMDKKAEANG